MLCFSELKSTFCTSSSSGGVGNGRRRHFHRHFLVAALLEGQTDNVTRKKFLGSGDLPGVASAKEKNVEA